MANDLRDRPVARRAGTSLGADLATTRVLWRWTSEFGVLLAAVIALLIIALLWPRVAAQLKTASDDIPVQVPTHARVVAPPVMPQAARPDAGAQAQPAVLRPAPQWRSESAARSWGGIGTGRRASGEMQT